MKNVMEQVPSVGLGLAQPRSFFVGATPRKGMADFAHGAVGDPKDAGDGSVGQRGIYSRMFNPAKRLKIRKSRSRVTSVA